jgi:RHS repeat-associated protein
MPSWLYILRCADGSYYTGCSTTYGYDIENRLVSASGGHTAALVYDANGRLWTLGGGTTQFAYDGDNLAVEYDNSGNVLRRYVFGPNTDEPLVWYEGSNLSDRRFLHTNHQGSVVAVSNSAGAAASINLYDEYGVQGPSNAGRFQYTGQAWIDDTGLYYYKARMYSPALGRFLQTDPVGYSAGPNLYQYVNDDPANHNDPTGNDAVWVNNPDGSKTLIIPVQFSGSGATGANVSAIVARDNSLNISDPSLHIQVVSTNTPVNGVLNKMDFSPGYNNKLCGGAGECVNKLGGNISHINSDNNQSTDAAAHEVLHFAGIKDQYVEGPRDAQGNRTSTAAPGYTNTNIMTSRSGTELKPQQFQEAKGNPSTKQCTVQTGSRIPVC